MCHHRHPPQQGPRRWLWPRLIQGWIGGWEKPWKWRLWPRYNSKYVRNWDDKENTFWKALWQGAARVQSEGFHSGLDASWEALGSFFILIFHVFSVVCFFVFYTWTLTTAPGIPSPFIQDETGDKVGASKDVKEDDSGSSKEAKGSQNGHALNKKEVNTEPLILNKNILNTRLSMWACSALNS